MGSASTVNQDSNPDGADFSPLAKIGLTWLFMSVILALFILRLWIQRHRKGSPARITADILSWSAWIIALIANGLISWEYTELRKWANTLPHDERTHPYSRVTNKKLHFFFTFSYFSVTWAVKGAFIAMYFDIFPTYQIQKRSLRYTMYGVAIYTAATFFVNIIASLSYCRPIETNWLPGPDNCAPFRSRIMLLVAYISNVTSDIFILMLPMSFIQRLRLRRTHYWGIAFLLALVFFMAAAATMRLVFLWRVFQTDPTKPKDFKTSAGEVHSIMTWTQVETWLTMIIFALPPLRVYIRRRKVWRGTGHTNSTSAEENSHGSSRSRSDGNGKLSPQKQTRSQTKWDGDDNSETELRPVPNQEVIDEENPPNQHPESNVFDV
ncbi:hypothetical protein EX30DRAFT_367219 [Ascodesmis nigricans]|uniref:Rhodopsin domain-containing protein n=1 Tax=Ascodesmis nigricans TaxID=341454 RepID=A0A4S2MIW3_9PEZI|nr:hypothetical protein EX30DRAFT_367219 [Ascodesmis nigricans]